MKYINHLAAEGYAFIPGSYYQALPGTHYENKDIFLSDLEQLKLAYESLTLDPYSPGNRWRGYAQCRRDAEGKLFLVISQPISKLKNTIRIPAALFANILCCRKILPRTV